ncbi:ankyrin repeat domain-containing protein [Balneolaceae bacterium ANBcel3]|nr:ankyrin repeat domain-containing protein [Balneolaceae bacterium ANBcel3]
MGLFRWLFLFIFAGLYLISCSDTRDIRLNTAVASGDYIEAEALLLRGANPNSLNADGMPLLGVALMHGHENIAERLLEYGAYPDQPAPGSVPLLTYIISQSHFSAARFLLSFEPRLVDTCPDGLTPIDYANKSGDDELVKLMEETIIRSHRQIPQAVRHSNLERLHYLADRSPGPGNGYQFPEDILHDAAYYATPEIVLFLVEWGVELNPVRAGRPPIIVAADNNRGEVSVQITRILLEHGVDIDTKDQWGLTPLMYALRWGSSPELAEFLLDHGADAFIIADPSYSSGHSNFRGYTTLMFAIRNSGNSRLPAIERMLRKGLDVNYSQSDHDFPLSLASCGSQASLEKVRLLLDYGADINHQSHGNGTTALQCAAYFRETEIFSYLLEHGADIYIKDHEGYDLFSWVELRREWDEDSESDEKLAAIFEIIEAHKR